MLQSIKCEIALCLKNNFKILHCWKMLSSDYSRVIIFLLMERLTSVLMAADWSGGNCWRLGGFGNFFRIRQWSLSHWLTLPFTWTLRGHCSVIHWPNFSTVVSQGIGRPAAAKSHQSCLTLCNPINGSPPGSSAPGILQERTLEWVAISFSNAWKWKVKVKSFSRVWLLMTPWTAGYQAPPSMGFSRQEYWSGVPWGVGKR